MPSLPDHLTALADLVLPRRCAGCGRAGPAYCGACRDAVEPVPLVLGTLPVLAAGTYDDALRRALLAYKERGRRDLAAPLADLLARALAGLPAPPAGGVLVLPPTDRRTAGVRGGDHVLRLARRAAARLGLRVAPGVLVPTRRVRDSAGLSIAARTANLAGSLRAVPADGRTAVLVDDIVTTGATLGEMARALRVSGWSVHGAAVVASTPRRRPPPHTRSHGAAQGAGLAWSGPHKDQVSPSGYPRRTPPVPAGHREHVEVA